MLGMDFNTKLKFHRYEKVFVKGILTVLVFTVKRYLICMLFCKYDQINMAGTAAEPP